MFPLTFLYGTCCFFANLTFRILQNFQRVVQFCIRLRLFSLTFLYIVEGIFTNFRHFCNSAFAVCLYSLTFFCNMPFSTSANFFGQRKSHKHVVALFTFNALVGHADYCAVSGVCCSACCCVSAVLVSSFSLSAGKRITLYTTEPTSNKIPDIITNTEGVTILITFS